MTDDRAQSNFEQLMEKLRSKDALIGVMGLGYVGLPLAVEKAKAGYRIIGFDIQEQRVQWVNDGVNYIGDVVAEDLAPAAEHLDAGDDQGGAFVAAGDELR